MFLFVHRFIVNLVNVLHSFLYKVLCLFYVKIHVPYILTYKSIHIYIDPFLTHQKTSKIATYKPTLGRDLHLWASGGDICTGSMTVQSAWQIAGHTKVPPRPLTTRWRLVGGWCASDGGEPTLSAKSITPCWLS